MGKNQSASGLTNVIQYNNGNITFVSGSTTLMSISSSGAITTTGVISGSNVLTASYANNAELLDGLDSTAFATTGAYSATSGSLYTVSSSAYATSGSLSATSGSLSAASGSFNTRVSALEVTGSALSSSILSVSSSAYATSGSLSAASGSFNTRVASLETYSTNLTAKTASFATTGSNTFIGSQVVSGSLTASGSITATGTITAQTLVVQTITSSVVYSSGSNVFGNDIGNSQVFTGSMFITGSNMTANVSNACFAGSIQSSMLCSSTINLTGNNNTLACNNTLRFTDTDTATEANQQIGKIEFYSSDVTTPGAGVKAYIGAFAADTSPDAYLSFATQDGSATPNPVERLRISSEGAATFSSTISGTTIYGSTAVCSPVGLFSGCVGVGISPQSILETFGASPIITITDSNTFSSGVARTSGIEFKAYNPSGNITTQSAGIYGVITPETGYTPNQGYLAFYTRLQGCSYTEKMRITSAGNVGIGTNNPASTLSVVGNGAIARLETIGSGYSAYLAFYESTTRVGYIGKGSGGSFDFYFWNDQNANIRFGTNNTERLVITSAGAASFTGDINTSSATGAIAVIAAGSSNTNAGSGRFVIYDTTNNRGWGLQQDASYKLNFWHYNGGWTSVASISSTGTVNSTQYRIAPNGTSSVYNIVDSDQLYAGSYNLQAGGGSAGYGGSLIMYGHSHATRAGFVIAGISSGSGGKFAVYSAGNGSGTEVFSVNTSGVGIFSSNITATGLSLSCSTGLQKIAASRLFTANTTTYYDTTINQAGMLIINSSNDRAGVFVVSAPGGGNSAISEIGDPSSYYSTTCNNANTVNFFFSGGSGNLIMQNCSGATRDFSLTHVGTP